LRDLLSCSTFLYELYSVLSVESTEKLRKVLESFVGFSSYRKCMKRMSETERRAFGERLQRRLDRLGKQNYELAKACNVSTSTVSNWVNGRCRIPPKRMAAVLAFLGTDIDRLYGASDEPDYVIKESPAGEDVMQQTLHRMRHDLKALNDSVDSLGRELVRRRQDQAKELSEDLLRRVVAVNQGAVPATRSGDSSPPPPQPVPRQKAG
jgi:transcriptional regulator with XRE-family HTH domain